MVVQHVLRDGAWPGLEPGANRGSRALKAALGQPLSAAVAGERPFRQATGVLLRRALRRRSASAALFAARRWIAQHCLQDAVNDAGRDSGGWAR